MTTLTMATIKTAGYPFRLASSPDNMAHDWNSAAPVPLRNGSLYVQFGSHHNWLMKYNDCKFDIECIAILKG